MAGAKSGQARLTPLEYFTIEGRTVIIGTYDGAPENPTWAHNLRANPMAHIEICAESYDVAARELPADERDALFSSLVERAGRMGGYRTRTTRMFPIFELRRI